MNLDAVDYIIGGAILVVVLGYAVFRLKEEKKKEKINYVPMLLSYLEKFEEEKKEFQERAENFKQKLKESEERLKQLKAKIKEYRWKKYDIERLKQLKGTELETYLTGILEIMGYNITEPAIYKDHNIDFIINLKEKKICIDFIDYTKVKKLGDKYLQNLIKGKEKYGCKTVWIITNAQLNEKQKKEILDKDINVISLDEITSLFPSIRLFDDYFDAKTVYHNYELLYKETYDEVIRRDAWIEEVQEKLNKTKLGGKQNA